MARSTACRAWLGLPLALACAATCAHAAVTGRVEDAASGAPIAGARVHVQAQPQAEVVLTDAGGRFSLPVPAGASVTVAAARSYDPAASDNYETGAIDTSEGADVILRLRRIPDASNPDYQPLAALGPFSCDDCHVEQAQQWSGSAHAGAALDPWVLDLYSGDGTPGGAAGYVFLDTHDPGDTGLCSVCHAPTENPRPPFTGFLDQVASPSGLEGVTCTACHQLHSVNANTQAIHLLGNAEYRFPDSGGVSAQTHQYVWGPLDDVNFVAMRPSYQPVFRESRFCASCHEYVNPDTGTAGQTTYSEWLDSPAAAAGMQCQDCHMPQSATDGTLADVNSAPLRPASQRHSHAFAGSTQASLADAVTLSLEARMYFDRVVVNSTVHNGVLGHAFPTGISLRNAFVLVQAEGPAGALVQAEGDVLPFWLDDEVAGTQEGDHAGRPGRGYAKVLEGRINGQGSTVRPVLFIDAENVFADSAIPAGGSDTGRYEFALPPGIVPGDVVSISARLVYRRAWRALAVTKGWTDNPDDPWEYDIGDAALMLTYDAITADALFGSGFEVGD